MVGAKGYSSYRGRGPKWKIFLAILLVLVIAVAVSVIYLGEHVVYSPDGRRQIVLPWQSEGKDPKPSEDGGDQEGQPNVDLVVQEPEGQKPKETTARTLPVNVLTQAAWSEFKSGLAAGSANAAAVRLKTTNGTVYYESASAVSGAVQVAENPGETMETLRLITSEPGLYTIASVACLQDFKAANADVEGRGLKNTGGYIFYDGNNSLWLDPGKPGARAYVCAMAKEVAELGFDELLLTDFCYPTVGKVDKIDYNTEVPLGNNLDLLLGDLRTALEPYDIRLSVEVPEAVITNGPDGVAGLDLNRLAGQVDRVYAVTTPEKVETLSNLVSQTANGKTEFVPELREDSPSVTGSRLILPEAG